MLCKLASNWAFCRLKTSTMDISSLNMFFKSKEDMKASVVLNLACPFWKKTRPKRLRTKRNLLKSQPIAKPFCLVWSSSHDYWFSRDFLPVKHGKVPLSVHKPAQVAGCFIAPSSEGQHIRYEATVWYIGYLAVFLLLWPSLFFFSFSFKALGWAGMCPLRL